MKKLSLLMMLLLSAMLFSREGLASSPERNCEKYFDPDFFSFGEDVNVRNRGDILFILETTTDNAQFETKVKAYGSFECDVRLKKLSSQCLLISVDWSPGADSSGCFVEILKNNHSLGQSQVYMSY